MTSSAWSSRQDIEAAVENRRKHLLAAGLVRSRHRRRRGVIAVAMLGLGPAGGRKRWKSMACTALDRGIGPPRTGFALQHRV